MNPHHRLSQIIATLLFKGNSGKQIPIRLYDERQNVRLDVGDSHLLSVPAGSAVYVNGNVQARCGDLVAVVDESGDFDLVRFKGCPNLCGCTLGEAYTSDVRKVRGVAVRIDYPGLRPVK